MMDEKKFDYETYIQKRLKEIDDLDERKYTKELLLEGVGKLFAWTEAKYEALEQRIQRELDMPGESFHTCMTVVDRKDYDPINLFWFPVCEEDVKSTGHGEYETIYLMADEGECRDFLDQKSITGIDIESGRELSFQIRRADRYQKAVRKLFTLFAANHIPWQTVHMGHLERFFELVPPEELPPNTKVEFQWGRWEDYAKRAMLPLWNIQKMEAASNEFRMPCIEEVFYEHIFCLPQGRAEGDGYLVETKDDILSIRYEQNRVVLKTKQESIRDVCVYRMRQGEPAESFGYRYPILSNCMKDNLAARYLHQTGNFLQTPMELCRKMKEMAGCYEIEILGYEIVNQTEEETTGGKLIFGDMNEALGAGVFSDRKRSILLIRLQKDGNQSDDYLYESQIRYILSQLQMEFMEYKCVGALV